MTKKNTPRLFPKRNIANNKGNLFGLCLDFYGSRPIANDCILHMDPPPKRADPAIYSQTEEHLLGHEPTWVNPDFSTYIHTGVPPNVICTITNKDMEVAAANVFVHFSIGDFGIGTEMRRAGSVRLYIPPATSVDTPFVHFSIPNNRMSISIEFPTDREFGNNKGEFAAQVIKIVDQAEREVKLQLRNPYAVPRILTLKMISIIGQGELERNTVTMGPLEKTTIILKLTLPLNANPNELHDLTVYALDEQNKLIGGVTYRLTKNTT